MNRSSEVLAGSLARQRGLPGPERRDRAAAIQLLHDLHASGFVLARRIERVPLADLTWAVARGIHQRCCQPDLLCEGPSEHLSAAAVAVEMLGSRLPPAPQPLDPSRLAPVA